MVIPVPGDPIRLMLDRCLESCNPTLFPSHLEIQQCPRPTDVGLQPAIPFQAGVKPANRHRYRTVVTFLLV